MIADCRYLPDRALITGDYCVIGAGPAGITVANELARGGRDVLLIESGGRHISRFAQNLGKGEVLDTKRHGALDKYRHRRFGGTSDVWGGRCAPFDRIDFASRPYVAWSGWPVSREDLDPWYARAHTYCDLGRYSYAAGSALSRRSPAVPDSLRDSDVHLDFIWRFSLPTDFGRAFWRKFADAERIRVFLNGTALRLRLAEGGEAANRLEVGVEGGKKVALEARRFIIATGGLEAARLLLNSTDTLPQGIGNSGGLVGRFYISHITGDLGQVSLKPEAVAALSKYLRTDDGVYCRRTLSLGEGKQEEHQLLNFRAILSHPEPGNPSHGSGVLSAMYLTKKYFADRIPPEYSAALSDIRPTQHVMAHCRNIVLDCAELARFGSVWTRKRILSRRKLPSVIHESRSNIYTLHFDGEQAPNPNSRVMLSEAKDEFGLNRLLVDWRCMPQDIDSVVRSAALIGDALRESGLGQFHFDPGRMRRHIEEQTGVGSHHLGTTRMADSPAAGVVDRNCKVHGIDNIWIASSSVFPTSSFANPTLTIVALAIRLAAHLNAKGERSRNLSDRASDTKFASVHSTR